MPKEKEDWEIEIEKKGYNIVWGSYCNVCTKTQFICAEFTDMIICLNCLEKIVKGLKEEKEKP